MGPRGGGSVSGGAAGVSETRGMLEMLSVMTLPIPMALECSKPDFPKILKKVLLSHFFCRSTSNMATQPQIWAHFLTQARSE